MLTRVQAQVTLHVFGGDLHESAEEPKGSPQIQKPSTRKTIQGDSKMCLVALLCLV